MSLPAETKQWLYTAPPQGLPTLSGTNPTFSLKKTRLAPLQTNQVLLRTVYISNDPAQRGWISPMADPSRLYTKPVPLNTCMRAQALCEVLDSKAAQFSKGDHVLATSGWAEYAVVSARECQPAPPLPGNVRETHYLGALGAPGVTAYYGLVEVARTKPTDVVVVSGAAGATGSMAVQIARGLLGSRKVVGIAGGKSKCDYVKGLGADDCVDYKSATFRKDLFKATGRKADVFFDNVGGNILNLMLTCMARDSRIAVCGAISSYNDEQTNNFRAWGEVISQRIEIKGFVVFDFWHRQGEIMEVLRRALAEGRVRIGDENETVVQASFEDVPRTWLKLFEGGNTGKLVTELVRPRGSSKI